MQELYLENIKIGLYFANMFTKMNLNNWWWLRNYSEKEK